VVFGTNIDVLYGSCARMIMRSGRHDALEGVKEDPSLHRSAPYRISIEQHASRCGRTGRAWKLRIILVAKNRPLTSSDGPF
jgi:hypothetical protein